MGCDEFEYPMTLQWSVKPGDERNLELQATVIAITHEFEFFLAFSGEMTKPKRVQMVKQIAQRVCRGDEEEANLCVAVMLGIGLLDYTSFGFL
jgi:hypothetical protein